jgi:hypothetical protein
MTETAAPATVRDQKVVWLDEKIWPEIIAMMHGDAYFRLWLKAQELAQMPCGPIAQTIITGYATSQLAAIRRLADQSADAISLPKLLQRIGRDHRELKASADALEARLKEECRETCALATQYIAHNGNPARSSWLAWSLTSDKIVQAQKAICDVAVAVERDLLALRHRTHLIPVPQFDQLAEVRGLVSASALPALRTFWDAHNAEVNGWLRLSWVDA